MRVRQPVRWTDRTLSNENGASAVSAGRAARGQGRAFVRRRRQCLALTSPLRRRLARWRLGKGDQFFEKPEQNERAARLASVKKDVEGLRRRFVVKGRGSCFVK